LGRWVIKERTVLNKCDITRDTYATSGRIITTITLMLRTISQKNTFNRLSRQLGSLTRCKQNIASTSENPKMIIVRRSTKKDFTRTLTR
jgi:hypothetical protein